MSQFFEGRIAVFGPTKELKEFKEFAMKEGQFLSEERFMPYSEKYKDWDCSDFLETEIEYESDWQIRYKFFTWSKPILRIVIRMGETFPALMFDYHYWSPEYGLPGHLIVQNGVEILNECFDDTPLGVFIGPEYMELEDIENS